MLRFNNTEGKSVDRVLVFLLFFILTLVALFFYYEKKELEIQDYYEYKETLQNFQKYNRDLDNILLHSYRYIDYDMVTKASNKFDNKMEELRAKNIHFIFGDNMEEQLLGIEKAYNSKNEIVEKFKTLNARITNSMYYLYELEKEFESSECENIQLESLLSEILFKIGQVFLGTKVEELHLDLDLKSLSLHRMIDKNVEYFYIQTKTLVRDVAALQKIIEENNQLDFDGHLSNVSILLYKEYLSTQKIEQYIGIGIFLLSFIMLFVLIRTYLNSVTNRKRIFYLAYNDTLTNLPNRVEFERYIDALTVSESTKKFAVLFIDIDRFKIINDSLGHDIGDKMLINLSEKISHILGKNNFLARLGGDEFVAIIEEKRDMQGLNIYIDRLIEKIREPMQIDEYNLTTTASIGIAIHPKDGNNKSILLRHADVAMYHAKELGRDTYAFYVKEMTVKLTRRLALEQELVHASKNKEFSLAYQPQYRLDSGKICGVEALLRWDNKVLGSVSPEEFISVAEDTGLIVNLGYYIFHEACSAYRNWEKQGIHIGLLAINVSSVQLRQVDAFDRFKKIIDDTGIDAHNIEIELTERYIMEYATGKLTILDDLRSLGCRISIDDFGTGYSSMSYLKSLAIDTIKIDKSFILELPKNQHDAEVSKAIIALSQSLGYEVIAEGIETKEQEELLKSYNCDMGQGYYFAKPMASKDIVAFYRKINK